MFSLSIVNQDKYNPTHVNSMVAYGRDLYVWGNGINFWSSYILHHTKNYYFLKIYSHISSYGPT